MYICLSCRNDAFGTFDFIKGLERLKKDSLASYEQLTIGVERENLLRKKVPLDGSDIYSFINNKRTTSFTQIRTSVRGGGGSDPTGCIQHSDV